MVVWLAVCIDCWFCVAFVGGLVSKCWCGLWVVASPCRCGVVGTNVRRRMRVVGLVVVRNGGASCLEGKVSW